MPSESFYFPEEAEVTDLNQLFKTVSSKKIVDFVKDIGLYNSL